MNPWKYFKIAAEAATLKTDFRTHKLGAVGLRADGALVVACNGPVRVQSAKSKCNTDITSHAESRLCKKMDYYGTVFVARIAPSGYMLSRPCASCRRILKSRRVQRVYYTISDSEYGVLDL